MALSWPPCVGSLSEQWLIQEGIPEEWSNQSFSGGGCTWCFQLNPLLTAFQPRSIWNSKMCFAALRLCLTEEEWGSWGMKVHWKGCGRNTCKDLLKKENPSWCGPALRQKAPLWINHESFQKWTKICSSLLQYHKRSSHVLQWILILGDFGQCFIAWMSAHIFQWWTMV